MKDVAGFSAQDLESEDSDIETEAVFRELRPNANYKLVDILTGKVKEPKPKMYLSKSLRM
jgi:hypothetical protein